MIRIAYSNFQPSNKVIHIGDMFIDANDDDADTKRLYDLLMEIAEKTLKGPRIEVPLR